MAEEVKKITANYIWAVLLCNSNAVEKDSKHEIHACHKFYDSYDKALDAAANFLRKEFMGRRDIEDADALTIDEDTPTYKQKWDKTELFLNKFKDIEVKVTVNRLD